MKKFVYIASDIMSTGAQHEISLIEEVLDELGFDYYSARKNSQINDKTNVTVEENNKLAEKIVEQDTDRIKKADIIIFNIKSHALGTLAELGQVWGLNNNGMGKKCFFLYDDIRRTDLPETSDRRSWSINQYIYGLVLALSEGRGFLRDLDELKRELKKFIIHKLKPKRGDRYYYVNSFGNVYGDEWSDSVADIDRLEIGNVFKTEKEAEFEVERLKILAIIRKYSRPFKKEDENWSIYFDETENFITYYVWGHINFSVPIFESREMAQKVIDEIGEDRLKKYYFRVEE
ncbi:nucleoside 2-deoxyribosyltransferase [Peptostreptococcus sp.]|uniref:nucleoside 2-deoxyribosyltransferase n=1 Tax=Peptostreptococcus sp. TaxID=1262 RepID=UPI001D92CF5C|nr:nucleoside 2-deoxyribosyltransferase [Peptostreptococcus sp.]MBS5596877.1 nucleoside 2-deoxyribosyltransferase [Peptostreptococcus sp.]